MSDVTDLIERLRDALAAYVSEGSPDLADDVARIASANEGVIIEALKSLTRPASDGVEALREESNKFRALLIEAGRSAGAFIDDTVSDNFLELIPGEVRAKIAALSALPTQSDAVAAETERCARIARDSDCKATDEYGEGWNSACERIADTIAAAIRRSAT